MSSRAQTNRDSDASSPPIPSRAMDGEAGSVDAAESKSVSSPTRRVVSPSATSKLFYAAAEIAGTEAKAAGELGFTARLLAQTTLPHSKPTGPDGEELREFERSNGRVTLYVQAGGGVGLPYGSMPRLVLFWLVTEAVRTKSRTIRLGDSLSAFMRELGLVPTGGRWGTITRLREQVRRLFASRLEAVERVDGGERRSSMAVADEVALWWQPRQPDQAALWGSEVVLSERFFEEVTRSPIPLDLRALRALKRSPLGLDLYAWLCHRVGYVHGPTFIPWRALHAQFGADYADVRTSSGPYARTEKDRATLARATRADKVPGGIRLLPSRTHIPRAEPKRIGPPPGS